MLSKITVILIMMSTNVAQALPLNEIISIRADIEKSLDLLLQQVRRPEYVALSPEREQRGYFCFRQENDRPLTGIYQFQVSLFLKGLADLEFDLLLAKQRLNNITKKYSEADRALNELRGKVRAAQTVVAEFAANTQQYEIAVKVLTEVSNSRIGRAAEWKQFLQLRSGETDSWVRQTARKLITLLDLNTLAVQNLGQAASFEIGLTEGIGKASALPVIAEKLELISQQIQFSRAQLESQLISPQASHVIITQTLLAQARLANGVFDPSSPWELWHEVLANRANQFAPAFQSVLAAKAAGIAMKSSAACSQY